MSTSGRLLVLSILASLALPAAAQPYRWVDPASGRVIVSDQPPPAGVKSERLGRGASAEPAEGAGELPPALRGPASRFPVTLFSAPPCGDICVQARATLQGRGIPYTEKVVDTIAADEELKRLTGQNAIPTLLVGRQAMIGYDPSAWHEVFNLAGYPERRVPGYKPPPPAKPTAPPAPEAPADAPAQ